MSRLPKPGALPPKSKVLDVAHASLSRGAGLVASDSQPRVEEAYVIPLQEMDRDAWAAFYLEHRRVVAGVLAVNLGYRSGLDDQVQEVFMIAVDLVRSGRVRLSGDRSGLRAWLIAISQRVSRAEARRRGRLLARQGEDEERLVAQSFDPECSDAVRRMGKILIQLPQRLRTPWVLRNLEHMTLDEISSCLGVSTATAKRRLTRADRRFRSLVHNDPVLREYLMPGGAA